MSNFTWGTFKLFLNFISLASQDLLKWATNEENRALQDVANQLAELNLVWTEVQREFCGKLMCVCVYKINHCTLLNMRLCNCLFHAGPQRLASNYHIVYKKIFPRMFRMFILMLL